MLYLPHCYSSGLEDTSKSLRHVTAHTSEHGFVRSFSKASKGFSFRGLSKYSRRCYIFPCSCSFPAWLCSFATLISRPTSWYSRGSAFAPPYTGASHLCQSFATIAHTIPPLHQLYGTSLLGYHLSPFESFCGLVGRLTFLWAPTFAFMAWRQVIANCSCRACRGQPRRLL